MVGARRSTASRVGRYSCFRRRIGENSLPGMERLFKFDDGGDAGGGVHGDVVVAFVVGACDIRLSKRNMIRGPHEWCVLLSLNP